MSNDVGNDIAHSPGLSLGSPSASVEFFGQLLEAISRLRIALAYSAKSAPHLRHSFRNVCLARQTGHVNSGA